MGALLLAMVLSQTAGFTVQPLVAGIAPPPLPIAGSVVAGGADQPPVEEHWNGYPASAGDEPAPVAAPAAGASNLPELPGANVEAAPAAGAAPVESWPLPLASEAATRVTVPEAQTPAAPTELATAQGQAGPAGCDGYQAACWGSSQQQVGSLFPSCVSESPQQLSMRSEVAGESSETRFFFVDDQLVAVSVTFSEALSRPARYLALYANVRDGLVTKYGPLAAEKEEWDAEHFKAMERGMALVLGGLRLSSTWRAGATAITLSCAGGELKGRVQISYASLGFAPLLQRQAERRQLQGL